MDSDPLSSDKALLDRYGSMKQPPKLKGRSSKACPTITSLVIVSVILALLCYSAVRIYLFECISSSLSTDCSGKVCATFVSKGGKNYVVSDETFINFTQKIRWAKKNNDLHVLFIDVGDAIPMISHIEKIVSFCHKIGITVILTGVNPSDICNEPSAEEMTEKRKIFHSGIDGISLYLEEKLSCAENVNVKDFRYWMHGINQNRSKKLDHVPTRLFLEVSVKSEGSMNTDVDSAVRPFSVQFPIENATLLLDNKLGKSTTDIPKDMLSIVDVSQLFSNIIIIPSLPMDSSRLESAYFYYFYLFATNKTFLYDLHDVFNENSAFGLARDHYTRVLKMVDLQAATAITQANQDSHHVLTYTLPSGTYYMFFFKKSPSQSDLTPGSLVTSFRILARCQHNAIEFANKKGTIMSIAADLPILSVIFGEKAENAPSK